MSARSSRRRAVQVRSPPSITTAPSLLRSWRAGEGRRALVALGRYPWDRWGRLAGGALGGGDDGADRQPHGSLGVGEFGGEGQEPFADAVLGGGCGAPEVAAAATGLASSPSQRARVLGTGCTQLRVLHPVWLRPAAWSSSRSRLPGTAGAGGGVPVTLAMASASSP